MTQCPACGAPLVLLRSLFKKACSNGKCAREYDWPLKDGHAPLITTNRDTRK